MKFLKKLWSRFRRARKEEQLEQLDVFSALEFAAPIMGEKVFDPDAPPVLREIVEDIFRKAGVPPASLASLRSSSWMVKMTLKLPVSFGEWLQACGIDASTALPEDFWVNGEQLMTAMELLANDPISPRELAAVHAIRDMAEVSSTGRLYFSLAHMGVTTKGENHAG